MSRESKGRRCGMGEEKSREEEDRDDVSFRGGFSMALRWPAILDTTG